MSYVGAGNSTSKKDAQANAARDFCNFLVRTGEMKQEDIPGQGSAAGEFCLLIGQNTIY